MIEVHNESYYRRSLEKRKDDKEYYSGVLRDLHGDINIAVFPNTKKEAENQPDMNIVLSFWYKKDEDVAEKNKNKKEALKEKIQLGKR